MVLVNIKDIIDYLDKDKLYYGYRSYLQPIGEGIQDKWRGVVVYYDFDAYKDWVVEELRYIDEGRVSFTFEGTLREASMKVQWCHCTAPEKHTRRLDTYDQLRLPIYIEPEGMGGSPITEEMYF